MRLFGRRTDPVDQQLRDIARQGSGMAAVAHFFAMVLLVLFSLASFVALAGDAFTRLLTQWRAHALDIPSAISVLVSILIVPAMDWAMLYAASHIRRMVTRRVGGWPFVLHSAVIVVVALVEGAAYIYMSAIYEHPATAAAWAIIIARGVTAPLLAVYLSMAHPLPVTHADIFYQVELASGAGLIRDVVRIANDADAPLSRKMALYGASARMGAPERSQLESMIEIVDAGPYVRTHDVYAAPDAPSEPSVHFAPSGTSLRALPRTNPASERTVAPESIVDGSVVSLAQNTAPRRRTSPRTKARITKRARTVRTGEAGNASYEPQARAAWANGARTDGKMMKATGMAKPTAASWVRTFKAEERAAAEAAAQ